MTAATPSKGIVSIGLHTGVLFVSTLNIISVGIRNRHSMPTLVDLFCGCGGTSCGFQMAGWTPVCAVDINDDALESYKLNFPHTEVIHGDMKSASIRRHLLTHYRGVDAVIGGPPCQGFSKRNLTHGKRYEEMNKLPLLFARIALSLQPKFIFMEEVASALPAVKAVRGLLEKGGYNVYHTVLLASNYDVPQNRKRLILIATANATHATFVPPKPSLPTSAGQALRQKPAPPKGSPVSEYTRKRIETLVKSSTRLIGGNYAIMNLRRPSPTIHTQTRSATGPYTIKRRAGYYEISCQEAARLQSFPHTFRFFGKQTSVRKQIGNAVPPMLAKHIANGMHA